MVGEAHAKQGLMQDWHTLKLSTYQPLGHETTQNPVFVIKSPGTHPKQLFWANPVQAVQEEKQGLHVLPERILFVGQVSTHKP